MANNTKTKWWDITWSPITGCTPISEGCKNCYAKRMAKRLSGRFGYPEDDPFRVTCHDDNKFNQPLKWRKPRRIFVCSMGDLFHPAVPFYRQVDIWKIMEACYQHTFLILTKRPEIMKSFIDKMSRIKVLHNLFCGVTAENQKRADERIPVLLQIPAAVRFVSVEPLLEHTNIERFLYWPPYPDGTERPKINWTVAGPETGPGARPCKPEWIESLYEQCQAAGVPFFDKRPNYLAREFPKRKMLTKPSQPKDSKMKDAIIKAKDLFESICCLGAEGVEFYSNREIIDSILKEAGKGYHLCKAAIMQIGGHHGKRDK